MPRGKQILESDGMNWTWYCEIDWQGTGRGEATILRLWREHKGESVTEGTGRYCLIEDSQRVVCAIEINGMTVAVKNREMIWNYPDV